MGRKAKVTELSPEMKQFVAECCARKANLELTTQEVAYRTKLGEGWTNRFFKGEERNPTADTLVRLATALDLTIVFAVCPKPGSYDEKLQSVYGRRMLSQLVPSGEDETS